MQLNCPQFWKRRIGYLFMHPNVFLETIIVKPKTEFTDFIANGRIYWTSLRVFNK